MRDQGGIVLVGDYDAGDAFGATVGVEGVGCGGGSSMLAGWNGSGSLAAETLGRWSSEARRG